jgi:poly-gamma-glutamate synthesis protein (capsule biosynthesis protein)
MDSDRNHSASSEIKKVKPNKRGVIIAIVTAVAIIPIVLILLNFSKKNQPKPIILDQQKDSVSIKIVFSGDLMGHMPWINSGLKNGTYCYDTSYTYIKPYIEKADYAILNLETTLNGPPYTGYPMFTSPDALAADAKKAGFDYMALANNHCADRGNSGIRRTNYVLDSLKIPHTGSFNDTAMFEKNHPSFIEVKGIKIAILNYTYSTNGIPVYGPNYVNIIDSVSIMDGIKKAKAKNPDFIISIMHWGEEYSRTESDRQERFAKMMAANGVDLVFGAHPHVVQPIKTFPSARDSSRVVPVFYSVGNFLCNQRDRYKDGGIFAEVTICKVEGKTYLNDYSYYPFWVRKNEANRSYVAIPLNNWDKNVAQFNLPEADSLLAVQFLNDTKKTIGDGVRISRD